MIYEQDSFEPVAQLIWVRDGLIAANDEPTAEERRDAEGWYGNNKPIIKKGVQVYHYHNDHLGTPNELTDQQGEVVWYADYQAWGNTAKVEWKEQRIDNIVVSEEHLQPIRFQGQSFDEETGLHYNRFRYFDPDMGMFTTRDPIGLAGGSNVFQYAPNPVDWIDPFGLNPKCRVTGNKVKKASDLPVVKPGTKKWDEAVESLNKSGRGDVRVSNAQDAKKLMHDAGLQMDRRKMYTPDSYAKGYEVHKPQPGANRSGKQLSAKERWATGESSVGNDLPHIKWKTDSGNNQGHIFFGD